MDPQRCFRNSTILWLGGKDSPSNLLQVAQVNTKPKPTYSPCYCFTGQMEVKSQNPDYTVATVGSPAKMGNILYALHTDIGPGVIVLQVVFFPGLTWEFEAFSLVSISNVMVRADGLFGFQENRVIYNI